MAGGCCLEYTVHNIISLECFSGTPAQASCVFLEDGGALLPASCVYLCELRLRLFVKPVCSLPSDCSPDRRGPHHFWIPLVTEQRRQAEVSDPSLSDDV